MAKRFLHQPREKLNARLKETAKQSLRVMVILMEKLKVKYFLLLTGLHLEKLKPKGFAKEMRREIQMQRGKQKLKEIGKGLQREKLRD